MKRALAFGLLFFALASFFLAGCLQQEQQPAGRSVSPYEAPYLESLVAGRGATNYYYSYEAAFNSQRTGITATRHGDEYSVSITTRVSTKTTYLLKNQTVICVDELGQGPQCADAGNDSSVASYVQSVRAFLLDDAAMDRSESVNRALIEKGAITFANSSLQRTVSGRQCTQISYEINYSKLSVSDARSLGVTAGTPPYVAATACLDASNLALSRKFDYEFNGQRNTNEITIVKADFSGSDPIAVPANLTNAIALDLLLHESGLAEQLSRCDLMNSSLDRDRCVFSLALYMNSMRLCEYAGSKRDTCVLNLAVERNSKAICDSISAQDTREDCYIELAGRNKDSSYCNFVETEPKKALCASAASNETSG